MELLQQGVAKIQDGDAEQGLADLERAIEKAPRFAAAHFYAGMARAQLRRWEGAYAYFVDAADLAPGFGEAHMQACRVAYQLERFNESWEQAILAAQAGMDMEAAFSGLEERAPGPENWRRRLDVPRVFLRDIDMGAISFGVVSTLGAMSELGAARSGPPSAPFTEASGADSVDLPPPPDLSISAFAGLNRRGAGWVGELQTAASEARRRFGRELVRSPAYGVVSREELATYVLAIELDSVGGRSQGFIKLIDPATEEEVYNRQLELSDLSSLTQLLDSAHRYVTYLEEWLQQPRREFPVS